MLKNRRRKKEEKLIKRNRTNGKGLVRGSNETKTSVKNSNPVSISVSSSLNTSNSIKRRIVTHFISTTPINIIHHAKDRKRLPSTRCGHP